MTSPRYRCTTCGNLTRFNVTSTRHTQAFHHYDKGGELLEVTEVVDLSPPTEVAECRWCGPTGAVEATTTEVPADVID